MGNNKQNENRSRRQFFSSFFSQKEPGKEKVKMLTADGQLVEVDKEMLDKAKNRLKASNKDIFDWMNNPSKENS